MKLKISFEKNKIKMKLKHRLQVLRLATQPLVDYGQEMSRLTWLTQSLGALCKNDKI